jgi:hypothetical protein
VSGQDRSDFVVHRFLRQWRWQGSRDARPLP